MSKSRKSRKRKKRDKVLIISFMFLIICVAGIVLYYCFFNGEDSVVKKIEPKKKIKIVDEDSNKRPIAVMIDNNVGYNSHAGLQDAYLSYEIIVEGGLTRIMALFKDKDVSLIGPVRSSRHYFLDYALENDAVYGHYGWSEFAKNDISLLGVDNLNGITNAQGAYWRDKSVKAPHNVFTSIKNLKAEATDKNYSVTSHDFENLNYSVDPIQLNEM